MCFFGDNAFVCPHILEVKMDNKQVYPENCLKLMFGYL